MHPFHLCTERTPYPAFPQREKTVKLDLFINPAFTPPPALPGGYFPPGVLYRAASRSLARPHILQALGTRLHGQSHTNQHSSDNLYPTLHTHSLQAKLDEMADPGIAITSLLQDAFRRFYGEGWEEAYRQPVVKDFFLREVREELTRGAYGRSVETINRQVEQSLERKTSACTSTQPEAPKKCPCHLHSVLGAAEDLRFSTCPSESQLRRNREWTGIEYHQQ